MGESLGVSCSCSTAVTVRVRTARSALIPQAEAHRTQRNVATTEYVVVHSTSRCMFEECVELSAHVGDIARPIVTVALQIRFVGKWVSTIYDNVRQVLRSIFRTYSNTGV